jgi:hypothetical protein
MCRDCWPWWLGRHVFGRAPRQSALCAQATVRPRGGDAGPTRQASPRPGKPPETVAIIPAALTESGAPSQSGSVTGQNVAQNGCETVAKTTDQSTWRSRLGGHQARGRWWADEHRDHDDGPHGVERRDGGKCRGDDEAKPHKCRRRDAQVRSAKPLVEGRDLQPAPEDDGQARP